MADSKTELANLNKNLGIANRAIVANAEKLGTEAQKMIAKQIGEQRKDFSSFLAGRKLKAAIRNTDTTALEQAKKNLDMTKKAQESAVEQDSELLKLKRASALIDSRIQNEKNMSVEDQIEIQKKQSALKKRIDDKESEIRNNFNAQLQDNTEKFEKLTTEYNEKIEAAGKSDTFDKFIAGLKTLSGGLIDLGPILDDIVKYANAFKDVFLGTFAAFSESLLGIAILLGKDPSELFKDGIGKTLLGWVKSIGKAILTPFVKVFKGIFGVMKFLFEGLITVVGTTINGVVGFLSTMAGKFVTMTKNFLTVQLPAFYTWLTTIAGKYVTMTKTFLTVMLPAFYTWLTTMALNMYKMSKQSAVFLGKGAGKAFKGAGKALKTLAATIKSIFIFMGGLIKKFILVPIRIAVVALASAIAGAFTAAVGAIGAIPLAIAAAVIGLAILAYIFKDYLELKWGEFKTWFGESMDKLSELASSLGDWITEKWDTYVTQPIQKFLDIISNLVNMITDKIGEYKSKVGIISKEARTEVNKARDSGLYDEDAAGDSELEQSMVADAPTTQLQAILEDNDLNDENEKFVKAELDRRGEGYYLGAMSKVDSSDAMSNSGGDIAEGTLDAVSAANLIVTNIQQNSNQSNSNGTVVVSGNPTVVDVDPSAGKGNGMGWGSFAGQGGYG